MYEDSTDGDYSYIFDYAVNKWNNLGNVTIYNYYQLPNQDPSLRIEEIYDPNNDYIAYYDYDFIDEIFLITYSDTFFASISDDTRKRAILHEFGHALGLFEFNLTVDVNGQLVGPAIPEHRYNAMNQGVRDFPLEPGSCDIEVYDYLWE